MSGEFDDKPILLNWTILDDDINVTIDDLLSLKLGSKFWQAANTMIDRMIAGDPETPQIGKESHNPKFTTTALEVHNKARAFYGLRDIPRGVLATVEEKEICVTRTFDRTPSKDCADAKSDAGSLPSFFAKCKDTTLQILK